VEERGGGEEGPSPTDVAVSIDLDLVLHLHVSCSDAASNDHMRLVVILRTLLQDVEKSGNGRKKCSSSTGSSTCNDGRR